ncbi:hypothetical protein GALMADRAFT_143832 [Galerina marginata CBS 339.88]|uniref:Uncharacterized protein n=1 Tax=Galerina marginata (strain CBS 339.88) TaxID=685588 RepID=A0A067SKU9_GALM3|nr:hypothetical protein GALMADRAFT_143832 [Galerina marginata CBS 339.88]
MPETLTRTSFISADIVKVATSKETMYVVGKDGVTIDEVPMLESIKATGVIPEEYAVDYHLDPATVVTSLEKQGITTVEQLPEGALEELKAQINDPENVTIAPAFLVANKREAMENALKEVAVQQNE